MTKRKEKDHRQTYVVQSEKDSFQTLCILLRQPFETVLFTSLKT